MLLSSVLLERWPLLKIYQVCFYLLCALLQGWVLVFNLPNVSLPFNCSQVAPLPIPICFIILANEPNPKPWNEIRQYLCPRHPFHSNWPWSRVPIPAPSLFFSLKMAISPCCEKAHTSKGAWTSKEDARLIVRIQAHGEGVRRLAFRS